MLAGGTSDSGRDDLFQLVSVFVKPA